MSGETPSAALVSTSAAGSPAADILRANADAFSPAGRSTGCTAPIAASPAGRVAHWKSPARIHMRKAFPWASSATCGVVVFCPASDKICGCSNWPPGARAVTSMRVLVPSLRAHVASIRPSGASAMAGHTACRSGADSGWLGSHPAEADGASTAAQAAIASPHRTSIRRRYACFGARASGGSAGELAAQRRHAEHRVGRVLALVALAPAGAGERLVHVVDGEDAERARHARVERHAGDPARRLGTDEVVVVGLAADHRAEAGHAGVAAGVGAVAGGQRQLERAGHVVHLDARAGLLEHARGSLHEPLRQLLVEAADAGREDVSHDGGAAPGPRRTGLFPPPARARGPARAPRGSSPRRAPAPGGAACGRAAPSSRAGTRGCARRAGARSAPGRSRSGRSPPGPRSSSGCW